MISSFNFFFIIPICSVGYVRIQCIEKVACLKEPECVFFIIPVLGVDNTICRKTRFS
jgi:hypothetical protein